MYRYQNRSVQYQNKKYEIFWVTEFVVHINKRSSHPSHQIEIEDVEKLALIAKYVPFKPPLYAGLARHNNKYYNILCYFIAKPKRCIIKSCFVVNNPVLLKISKEMEL
jgi:hypothetical protein